MGRAIDKPTGRREARRNDRRDAMLEVAAQSFLRHGYAATTMSAIAAAIGGSKATLWSYFPSKEALFEAVLDRQTQAYREELTTLLDPCGDLERTLRSFCTNFVGRITSPKAIGLHRLVYAEAGRFPEIGAIFDERARGLTHRSLGAFVASAMDRGALRKADPGLASRALISMCFSGCHQRLLLGQLEAASAEQIAADADDAVDLFLRAYRPDAA